LVTAARVVGGREAVAVWLAGIFAGFRYLDVTYFNMACDRVSQEVRH
jgi:hypothetical protein